MTEPLPTIFPIGLILEGRRCLVVGGGVIGIEYATIFSALDVPVTLIDPRPQLLEFLDREVIDHLGCGI